MPPAEEKPTVLGGLLTKEELLLGAEKMAETVALYFIKPVLTALVKKSKSELAKAAQPLLESFLNKAINSISPADGD